METEIGVTDIALSWIRSFLTNNSYSSELDVLFGAPQGSVLGPKFFNIYVWSQPRVFKHCRFMTTSFADDANGKRTFSLSFQHDTLKYDIAHCMNEITSWMNHHFLKINPDKTEILLLYQKS